MEGSDPFAKVKGSGQGDERIGMILGQAVVAVDGLEVDPGLGLAGLLHAAGQGDGLASLNLVVMYQSGGKIPKNGRLAVHWLQRITDGFNVSGLTPELLAWARLKLGLAYLLGDGVVADRQLAQRWLRRAADLKSAYAEFVLGQMSEGGEKVDLDSARGWYERAASRGFGPAKEALKRLGGA